MATETPSPLPTIKDIKLPTSTVTVTDAPASPPQALVETIESLRPLLSKETTIYFPTDEEFAASTARWSTLNSPRSSAVVNVTSEADIAATVKWATENGIAFLPLSGGHGWTKTLASLPTNSIVINLRALNKVTVSLETGTAKISAGALTSEVIAAAHAADAHVMTGICNSVGAIPPMLGGGIGYLQSMYGLAVDNMLSARLVTATGEIITVSAEENKDLWWGLRGGGPNFGIVSELTVKAHKQVNGGVHWGGMIAFPGTEEYLEKVVRGLGELLGDMGSGKPIACTMIWAKVPPTFEPTLMIAIWYAGTPEEGEAAYAPLLSLGPVMNMTGPTPYPLINAPSDFACVKNGHKRPGFASAVPELPSISTFKLLFNDWLNLVNSDQDLGASVVLTELYGSKIVAEGGGVHGEDTAFAWRSTKAYFMGAPEFSKPELERQVWDYGTKFRDTLGERRVYYNFASGDEKMEHLFGGGERVQRLRDLKKKWDPNGAFSYYNPIR